MGEISGRIKRKKRRDRGIKEGSRAKEKEGGEKDGIKEEN